MSSFERFSSRYLRSMMVVLIPTVISDIWQLGEGHNVRLEQLCNGPGCEKSWKLKEDMKAGTKTGKTDFYLLNGWNESSISTSDAIKDQAD